jgi:hypothetical protein
MDEQKDKVQTQNKKAQTDTKKAASKKKKASTKKKKAASKKKKASTKKKVHASALVENMLVMLLQCTLKLYHMSSMDRRKLKQ